jgi:hypothetical protein
MSDYYWTDNPAVIFMAPLIMGSIVVGEVWQHYRNNTRSFYRMFERVFDRAILKDGGTRLSPGYWNKKAIPAVHAYLVAKNYSNARANYLNNRLEEKVSQFSPMVGRLFSLLIKRPLRFWLLLRFFERKYFPGYSKLRRQFARYHGYVNCLRMGSSKSLEFWPIGDSTTSSALPEGVFLLARLKGLPYREYWNELARRYVEACEGELLASPMASIHSLLVDDLVSAKPAEVSLSSRTLLLPDSCIFSSIQLQDGIESSFLLLGMPRNSEHRHEEIGAIIMNINGEDLFVDRGSLSYSHPLCNYLRRARYHNVITPLLKGKTSGEQKVKLSSDVRVSGALFQAVQA